MDLLAQLPPGGVRPAAGPAPDERLVRAVHIADPDAPGSAIPPASIVLAVGTPAEAVGKLARAAATAGAAGVVVRGGGGPPRDLEGAGVCLLELAAGHTWDELHEALRAALTAEPPVVSHGDLDKLADTIAALTGGIVTIEDIRSRVLAYSSSTGEIDELRRLSILGRSGPPAYLALLRKWGVYDRLAAREDVVEIAEHPELGVRRRLAVGIFAGDRQLGTIWVQQGSEEFPEHAARALLGAARVAAAELVADRAVPQRGEAAALEALLTGRASALPGLPPRAAAQPCLVVAFTGAELDADPAARQLSLDELTGTVRVHAAGLRRATSVAALDGRIYALLPELSALPEALTMARLTVADARRRGLVAVRAAAGPVVPAVGEADVSRRGADAALERTAEEVTSFAAARPQLMVNAAVGALLGHDELADPTLDSLIGGQPHLADTLRRYLDHGSDVVATARQLGAHDTTVRHRLRRIARATGLDLTDPDTRLAIHLQLRARLDA